MAAANKRATAITKAGFTIEARVEAAREPGRRSPRRACSIPAIRGKTDQFMVRRASRAESVG